MMKPSAFALLLFSLAPGSLPGEPPAVSNRAPGVDDIGYLPPEGAAVATNPPALAWLPEPEAEGYAVELARDARFTRGVIAVARTPYVLYTHTAALAPGTWYWRYACTDRTGARGAWSKVRSFRIAKDAQPFPRPGEDLIRARLPRQHPRLLLRPEEVESFRQARTGAQKPRWDELVRTAEEYLKAPLIPEPPPWTDGKWNAEEWRRNLAQGTRASEIAETLAFCYLLSGERRYGEGARKWLLHIAAWDPAGSTSMDVNDEAGMPILYNTSRAYDWAYDFLSEADRATLRAMARARGEEAFHWLHVKPFEQKAYNSHGGRMWHFLGEAAFAYYGELPEAAKWLDYALTIFWSWYPAYGDEEGGWAQGYAYWSSYINRSTWWFDALRAGLKLEGTDKPFYRHVGDFPMYVAPPGGALVGFGDFAESRPRPDAAAVVAYFARVRHKPEWQWYAEAWGQGDGAKGPVGFLRAARPDPPPVKAAPPGDWPAAKLFRGAGWASLTGNLLDARESVQVMLRAAPLGNISHSHADQNAIVLGAYGSPLLVNTGIRPWYGSDFCKQWYWTTKAHNALEIDGRGQPKTAEATGKVIVFQPGKQYDYVVGEATGYGEHVQRYRRHLVLLKPDVVVVFDEVRASRPVSLKFWLHGRAPFSVGDSGGRIGLTYENASLEGVLLAPGGAGIVQTDQYPIPPETGKTQPEWHLSAETLQKHAAARFVAVLGIGKAGRKIDLAGVEDVSSGERVVIRFQRAQQPVSVSFETGRPAVSVR
ncbi:MAG: DUF4962 domain-containing protein [Bryobacteraceae bacterium]